jgi:geranylgeranylglycerol-phosphate geranylgeranyltransferase
MPELGSRLAAIVSLLRPHNCLAAALLVFLGAYLGGGSIHAHIPPLLQAASVVWLVVAACNVINDIQDIRADQLNNPQRPIPSGRVTLPVAVKLAIICCTLALTLAWWLGPHFAGIAVVLLALGIGYSFGIKGTVLMGNALVGFLASSPLPYGALVSGQLTAQNATAAVLVFVFVVLREILGTISDQEGDRFAGLRTITTVWGMPAALRMLQVLGVLFVAASFVPWLLHLASNQYMLAILVCSTLPTVGIIGWLSLFPSKDSIKLSLKLTKWIWFTSLVPLILLK